MAPKDYRPYLYQTLCHFKLRNTQELASSAKLVHMNANFQNALRFAPPSKQAELTQIAASAYANAERQYAQIKQNLEQRVAACQRESNEAKAQYDIAHQAFQKAQEIAAEYNEPMKDLEEKRSAAFEQADQYQRQAEEFYKSRNYTHKGVTTNVISMGFGLRLVVKLVYLVIGIIVAWIASWFNWMLGAIVALVTVVFVFFPNTSRKKYQTLREKEKALNEQGQQYKEAYGKLYREKESKIAECNRLKNQCNQLLDKYQNAQKDLSNTQNNLGQLNQQHETSAAKARELRGDLIAPGAGLPFGPNMQKGRLPMAPLTQIPLKNGQILGCLIYEVTAIPEVPETAQAPLRCCKATRLCSTTCSRSCTAIASPTLPCWNCSGWRSRWKTSLIRPNCICMW